MKSTYLPRLKLYFQLMRFHKPIGTLLLLCPTLIALYLAANGSPDLKTLIVFCLGVIIMRAAGCVINDYADRDFDNHVSRTKTRPLATKQIKAKDALILFVLLLLIAFVLALQLNLNTILLATIAALLAIIYPFSKRITNYPQVILGMAFAWSIPMSYMQVTNHLSFETWLLFASTMAWVVAYDTQYAMLDKSDDLLIGIKSTAIAFGDYDKLIIFILQFLCLAGFVLLGMIRGFDLWFYVILACAFGQILYQQWLIKNRLPAKCMAAFLNNNYFGALLFAACYKAIH